MTVLLSHPLSRSTPTYDCRHEVVVQQLGVGLGSSTSRSTQLAFNSHSGTHVDAPSHFDPNGQNLNDLPHHLWVCSSPLLIDCPTAPNQLITVEQVTKNATRIPADCDFLMIRTGSEAFRRSDPVAYATVAPGISPELARYLRDHSSLKFLGIDSISISCPARSEEGREAHRILLLTRPNGRPPVLPVEDMALAHLRAQPSRVLISPLFFDHADGAPCTIFADI